MIDFADIEDDFEKTQRLPLLTAEIQLDEVLQRECAARSEIVELMRQNLQQRKDLERLRSSRHEALFATLHLLAGASDADANTEQTLFEVCGALKESLWKVLDECQMRGIALDCGDAASRTLENSCARLDHILSAPGFCASAAPPPVIGYAGMGDATSNVVPIKAAHA
jgi:hypothetical protein